MSALRQNALKRAIAVFVISVLMGRVAAPLVIAIIFGPVDHWPQVRSLIWCGSLVGMLACALLGWLEYCLTIRRGVRSASAHKPCCAGMNCCLNQSMRH